MSSQTLYTAVNQGRNMTADQLHALLTEPDLAALQETAYRVKLREIGNVVSLRGLVEMSNICTKNCYYCGIRKGNTKVKRFQLTLEEILFAAREAMAFGYGSIVLQSGERNDPAFVDFIEQAVREIKKLSNSTLGITLSAGEQTLETYQRWKTAGAHRYLLRLETSNPDLYRKLHPADHDYQNRRNCLKLLRQCDYQVGSGVLIGVAGQTVEDLVQDLLFFREMDLDMIGMGPYLPHEDTPLTQQFPEVGTDSAKQLEWGLRMIAATRIFLRDVNIAATTALQALASDGREQGLQSGANVIMPNVTATAYRDGYRLYRNKPGTDENSAGSRKELQKSLAGIGEIPLLNQWGDSLHYARRNRN